MPLHDAVEQRKTPLSLVEGLRIGRFARLGLVPPLGLLFIQSQRVLSTASF